ncbi:hypothetical protein GEV29_13260 [Aeromicrobium sp. SMF47]|uniref:Uncharacterized protein n=1 Tax=Aeromicrobium yanjiei TaxID=2662028 RepID=A0A5Q2ME64_9ACTN|nr:MULTISPECIES: hypothetical protein [Aeromicrobium]MRJ77508.1 hypothetical protein [Aeromicrobium yanjiei]MRK01875.1 hypothetical protein [Aeromicrobium sp. S22]QGG41384.1 hypothetical protein GEV26_08425 [Aeromicrobium yanjiei]
MTVTRSTPTRLTWLRTAILAAALAAGLSACTPSGTASDPGSARAQRLADELNANLARLELPPVDQETATALYGTDGGVSCENVNELQHELSLSQFGNNSLNLRRVRLDPSIVAYDVAVIATYCPEKAGSLRDVLGELKTDDTIPTS